MSGGDSLSDKIRRGDPLPAPVAAALSACTPITRLGMWWRLRQPATHVDAEVVSFGNLTAGGTGKTPAVIERARKELSEGRRVAVLTRGYGSPSGPAPADSEEVDEAMRYSLLGDEAALILRKAPGVVVIKNPDRVAGARRAIQKHNCDLLLLDDGYQYTRLHRDENVLIMDAVNAAGNGKLLPRGILREPLRAISRASHVIVTRCDQADYESIEALTQTIQEHAPNKPIRKTFHAPETLWNVANGDAMALSDLAGMDIVAACAIGHPESFFRTLEGLGANITKQLVFRDHAAISENALPSDRPVVMTEKDAIRGDYAQENLFALGIELRDC